MTLELGAHVCDVTPPIGLRMGGYGARSAVATGTLDSLNARVAVVCDETDTVVLVALDLVWVTAAWATPLRQRIAERLGCKIDHVLVAATHTHAGPAVFRSAVHHDPRMCDYETQLGAKVLHSAEQAMARRRPVSLAFTRTYVEGVAANRRALQGSRDDALSMLVARQESGRVAAVVASFGCHPTVLGADNLLYSRDLFGVAVDVASRQLDAPVLLFNGAAGDVSTRFTRAAQTFNEVERLGARLGDAITTSAASATTLADAPVTAKTVRVDVTPRSLPSSADATAQVSRALEDFQAMQTRGASSSDLRRCQAVLEGALAQLQVAAAGGFAAWLGDTTRPALVQRLQVAGCDVLAVPGELFSGVGDQACSARQRPALLVGYANDYLGYFVPSDLAQTGGYEALIAAVDSVSADRIAAVLQSI